MAGLSDFWSDSQKALDFLSGGNSSEFGDLVKPKDTLVTYQGLSSPMVPVEAPNVACTSSNQCASGWACVGGVCQPLPPGSGEAGDQASGPGLSPDCDPGNPNSPCNSGGPDACQQTPTCGDRTDARECCGSRCCYFGSASSPLPGVSCFCDECPPLPGCSSFCESYLKANGEVGPGCTEGPNGNSCDSCTYCNGGKCDDLFIGAPCWCKEPECGKDCETCDTTPGSPTLGECIFSESSCQICVESYNFECPCGVLTSVKTCVPYGENPWTEHNNKLLKACDDVCIRSDDPCSAPECVTSTFFGEDAVCPPGAARSGNIQVGDQTAIICEECTDNASCGACDCNCDDDCESCEICSPADCECIPDPECAPCEGSWRVTATRVDIIPDLLFCSSPDLVSDPGSYSELPTENTYKGTSGTGELSICGIRVAKNERSTLRRECGGLDTSGSFSEKFYILEKLTSDGEWVELTSAEAISGIIYSNKFYDPNQYSGESSIEYQNVQITYITPEQGG